MADIVSLGAPLPTVTNKRWWKVVAPKGTVPLLVAFLSDSFFGQWTHWMGDQRTGKGITLPCDNTEQCPYCQAGLGNRWTGFAPVWCRNDNDSRVVALTEGAARQLLPTLSQRGSLRGIACKLQRQPGKVNNPVQVTFEKEIPSHKLPPAFDIMDSLARLWGVNGQAFQRAPKNSKDLPARPDLLPDDDQGDESIPA